MKHFHFLLTLLLAALPLVGLHAADPVLIAHRGLLRHAPENTLPAFASCLELGMGFELDIRTTKGGKLVVLHDTTLARTTDGPERPLTEFTWDELRKFDAGSWFDPRFTGVRVPSLEETFALIHERKRQATWIALNIKGINEDGERELVRLLAKFKLFEESFAFDQSVECSQRLKALDPRVKIGGRNVQREELDARLAENANDVFLLAFVPTEAEVALLRKRGKQIFFNYAGPGEHRRNKTTWLNARDAGIDGMLTDSPIDCAKIWQRDRASVESAKATPSSDPVPREFLVGDVSQQTFRGFGASIKEDWMNVIAAMPREQQLELADLQWAEGGNNTLRIWLNLGTYAPTPDERHLDQVFSDKMAIYIRDAQERGLKQIIAGPCGMPEYLRDVKTTEKNGKKHRSRNFSGDSGLHAKILADLILDIKKTHAIELTASGIQNEPNTTHDAQFTSQQMVDSVKAFRHALDQRGLPNVKVIGPETASCDRVAYDMVEALKKDPAAWNALGGVATHSYNMAATPKMVELIGQSEKEYWQTESSVPGKENPGDAKRASILAHTAVSDMNHRVTHWIHFIGIIGEDLRDNGTRLGKIRKNNDGSFAIIPHYKYYYQKNLAGTFLDGAVMRQVTDRQKKTQPWTYGIKPELQVALGRNSDGSWAAAVSNFTVPENSIPTTPGYSKDNAGRAEESFEVTLFITELSEEEEVSFRVVRNTPSQTWVKEEAVICRKGKLTVTIHPRELLTLLSDIK